MAACGRAWCCKLMCRAPTRLFPVLRAVQCVAVRLGDEFGKLAAAESGFIDNEAAAGSLHKFVRAALGRQGDDDVFFRKSGADDVDRGGEVAVCGDEQCGVKAVVKGVNNHLGGDVDIGHFFFIACPLPAACAAPGFFKVVAKLDVELGQGLQCFKIFFLALCAGAVFACVDARGEVMHGFQRLCAFEHGRRQGAQV